jgi:hypothetical protein
MPSILVRIAHRWRGNTTDEKTERLCGPIRKMLHQQTDLAGIASADHGDEPSIGFPRGGQTIIQLGKARLAPVALGVPAGPIPEGDRLGCVMLDYGQQTPIRAAAQRMDAPHHQPVHGRRPDNPAQCPPAGLPQQPDSYLPRLR